MKCKNHHFLFHTVNLLVFVFDAFIIQAGFSSFHVHDFTFGSFHYFCFHVYHNCSFVYYTYFLVPPAYSIPQIYNFIFCFTWNKKIPLFRMVFLINTIFIKISLFSNFFNCIFSRHSFFNIHIYVFLDCCFKSYFFFYFLTTFNNNNHFSF